ncbi:MAG: hypothetical protein QOE51_5040 [Actinoplanes sp.]|nr:hypothetical protein [Actinoplanes sp.]
MYIATSAEPTPEQINKYDPAAFSNADLANYNSGFAKLKQANGGNDPSPDVYSGDLQGWDKLTKQEQDAYLKYTDDLSQNWKGPPPDKVAPDWDGRDDKYNPDTSYTGLSDDGNAPVVPPPVAGGEEGKGDLVVSTDAIKTFRSNLEKLQKILVTTQSNVENMAPIKPGYFGLGGSMYRAIIGDKAPGLQKTTGDFLHNAVNAFEKLMTDIDKMVKQYDSVEEMSTLTAEKLNKEFDDAFQAMGTLSKPSA